jgi:MarR family transcriptional regulator, lower aerobic nicotinate degradation pathway regulator
MALPSYVAGQVSRFGRRHLAAVLAEHELLLVHHAILSTLRDFGPQSQQEVANVLDLDKSHLVHRLDELEARGLLRRSPDRSDRRRYRVTLTPTGRRLINRLEVAAQASQQEFLSTLTASERTTLLDLLRRVVEANDELRFGTSADSLPERTPDDDQAPAV